MKGKRDQMRNYYGNEFSKKRTKELEKANKSSPVNILIWVDTGDRVVSCKFEIYKPKRR